ncbi:MAG TPA: hypothetical protein VFM07_12270 [Intrasporangium sp.]|nr:hypothetical protein [Intrasporangium sp.]
MRICMRAAAAALGVGPLLALGAVSAGAAGATTSTDVQHGLVVVVDFVNPCNGDPGVVSAVEDQVFHSTVNASGSTFGGMMEGWATFTPTDPSNVTYTGHFTTTFADNLRTNVEVSTFNINATGSDGSHLQFHDNARATLNEDGTVTVTFDHMFCGG